VAWQGGLFCPHLTPRGFFPFGRIRVFPYRARGLTGRHWSRATGMSARTHLSGRETPRLSTQAIKNLGTASLPDRAWPRARNRDAVPRGRVGSEVNWHDDQVRLAARIGKKKEKAAVHPAAQSLKQAQLGDLFAPSACAVVWVSSGMGRRNQQAQWLILPDDLPSTSDRASVKALEKCAHVGFQSIMSAGLAAACGTG